MRALNGQVAVVTGASSGLGAGVAKALARAGARVVVNYLSKPEGADQVVREIVGLQGEAIAVHGNVADEDEVSALFGRATTAFGRVDIVVANAGLQRDAPTAEMTLEAWRKVIDVNLTGQFLSCREALRTFMAQPLRPDLSRARGKIVCMSSVHETIPWAGHANYAASKGGLASMMRTLAQEYASMRIRVNAIAPGAIRTGINRAAWETPEAERKLLGLIPYGRLGEVEDVGDAAVWLASDASDYVTGTTLTVDGGMSLYPEFIHNG